MHNCLVSDCQKEFETEASLHKHLKAHKLLLDTYYQTYIPRHDRFDGSIIKFKNKEQYLNTDFNRRENLRYWMLSHDKEEVKKYCKELLIKRKEKKEIIYSPTQVELRTTLMPPIQSYDELFGSYYDLCRELGFIANWMNPDVFHGDVSHPKETIFIDSREQLPFSFPGCKTEVRGLKFGDYAYSNDEVSSKGYIERKSIQDFVGTFSGGFERFGREVERAASAGAYLVVLVEDTLNHCLNFHESPNVYRKTHITPEYVFHNVRELIQSYDNLQFLFVSGRYQSVQSIIKIFNSKGLYRRV